MVSIRRAVAAYLTVGAVGAAVMDRLTTHWEDEPEEPKVRLAYAAAITVGWGPLGAALLILSAAYVLDELTEEKRADSNPDA